MTLRPLEIDPELVRWDADGLCVAVAQDRLTGRVQMVAWMNREALAKTIAEKRATFYSRQRKRLWTKGETSGHHLAIDTVYLDCDCDTILLAVSPNGPSCHTGEATCFFRAIEEVDGQAELHPVTPAAPVLDELEREIAARKRTTDDARPSYTRSLLDGGPKAIGAKLREEADELARAIDGEDDTRVASEAADVLYHLLVGLASREVPLRAVLEALLKRRGKTGLEEKAGRGR